MAITVQVKPRKTTISSVTVARTANLNYSDKVFLSEYCTS